MLDAKGRIVYVNPAMEKILDIPRIDLLLREYQMPVLLRPERNTPTGGRVGHFPGHQGAACGGIHQDRDGEERRANSLDGDERRARGASGLEGNRCYSQSQ